MNWYWKNWELLLIIVSVAFMLLMIVDVIWGRKRMEESGRVPLYVGLVPTVLCLLGLMATLPVLFAAREIFVVLISPGSSLVWWGWVYAVKTILAFLLVTPLLFILGIAFTVKIFLPQTWIFN